MPGTTTASPTGTGNPGVLQNLSALSPYLQSLVSGALPGLGQQAQAITSGKSTNSPRGPLDWVYIVLGSLIIILALVFLALASRTVTQTVKTAKSVAKTAAVAAVV